MTTSEVIRILSALKRDVHEKAVFSHCKGVYPYVNLNTFDGILQGYINDLNKK